MDINQEFNPPVAERADALAKEFTKGSGDRREGLGYVYNPQIVGAVRVALATGRPLLVSGPSGSGKSSLAPSVARYLGWRYLEEVITSRIAARDLLYRFDTLRRLSDAELGRLTRTTKKASVPAMEIAPYIEPGVLWWAFDPASAKRRGFPNNSKLFTVQDLNRNPDAKTDRTVVLLDEIDKADPDVPNDLLIPIGSNEFQVQELETNIKCEDENRKPLVIITTNGERELPNAFIRRCLHLELAPPDWDRLMMIARSHFGNDIKRVPIYEGVAHAMGLAADSRPAPLPSRDSKEVTPSTAEFIDAIRACLELDVKPDPKNETWQDIERYTLWKNRIGPVAVS